MVRAAAKPGLSAGRFRHGPVAVGAGWTQLDLTDPAVRAVLLRFVGSHIRLHPSDVGGLAAAGLALEAGRLVEVAAAPPAPPPATTTEPSMLELDGEAPTEVETPAGRRGRRR